MNFRKTARCKDRFHDLEESRRKIRLEDLSLSIGWRLTREERSLFDSSNNERQTQTAVGSFDGPTRVRILGTCIDGSVLFIVSSADFRMETCRPEFALQE